MACSNCARCTVTSVSWTRVVSNCVCACATSARGGRASLEARLRELYVVGIGPYRIVEKFFLSISAAQLEIVQNEFCFQAELGGLVVGGGGLRLFASRRDAAPYAAPKINLIRKIKWQHE